MKSANQIQCSAMRGAVAWYQKHYRKVDKQTQTDIQLVWIAENAKTFRTMYEKEVNNGI